MKQHTPEYKAYLESDAWKARRQRALYLAGYSCNRCGVPKMPGVILQVHHRSYANLGDELDSDLEVVCKSCHYVADLEYQQKAGYQKALRTYIEKKYQCWNEYDDPNDNERLEEEFQDWLEKKQNASEDWE